MVNRVVCELKADVLLRALAATIAEITASNINLVGSGKTQYRVTDRFQKLAEVERMRTKRKHIASSGDKSIVVVTQPRCSVHHSTNLINRHMLLHESSQALHHSLLL